MKRYFRRNREDCDHTVRVLHYALQLLESEKQADPDLVILGALLHDTGRREARGNRALRHAEVGADKVRALLREQGWEPAAADAVADCILSHSLHSGPAPQSLEAKILFDADKLDLTGAFGIARSVSLGRQAGEPIYILGEDGLPCVGRKKERATLLRAYRQTLRHLPERLYTAKARRIAEKRQALCDQYFDAMRKELLKNYRRGAGLLRKYCD